MQEDFEIYIHKATLDDVSAWLTSLFPGLEKTTGDKTKTHRFKAHWNNELLPITVIERAAKPGFTSVWFDSGNTPWESDKACALAAFAALQKPVRCNPAFWQEGDDPDLWLEINAEGEQSVIWRTEDN